MAVAAAFGSVHWVGGEDGVEHVGRVDLGAVGLRRKREDRD